MREIVNAILYQTRTECQWRYLPKDLPPYGAVYYYFALWRRDGIDQQIHDLLRMQVREAAGRSEDPSAVVLDSQSVRGSRLAASGEIPASKPSVERPRGGACNRAGRSHEPSALAGGRRSPPRAGRPGGDGADRCSLSARSAPFPGLNRCVPDDRRPGKRLPE